MFLVLLMKSEWACLGIVPVQKRNITSTTMVGKSDYILIGIPRAIRVWARHYNEKTERHLKRVCLFCASEQLKQSNTHRGSDWRSEGEWEDKKRMLLKINWNNTTLKQPNTIQIRQTRPNLKYKQQQKLLKQWQRQQSLKSQNQTSTRHETPQKACPKGGKASHLYSNTLCLTLVPGVPVKLKAVVCLFPQSFTEWTHSLPHSNNWDCSPATFKTLKEGTARDVSQPHLVGLKTTLALLTH